MGKDKFSIIEFERSLGHASAEPQQAVSYACVELFRKACPEAIHSVFLGRHHLTMDAMGMNCGGRSQGSTLSERG